jgi:hypothetical protein
MFAGIKIMVNIRTSKILFFLLVFSTNFQLFSQDRVYKHYGVEDGLPSSEVYTAFQDSKGYMWFATDAGVSRFNGYEFENFDVSDGLTDNTVFLITEDHKGRIRFVTFNCKLSFYENDSIYAYPFNHKIAEHKLGSVVVKSLTIDAKENIYLGFYKKGIFKCDNKGNCSQILKNARGKYVKNIFKVEDNTVFGAILSIEKGGSDEKIKKGEEIVYSEDGSISITTDNYYPWLMFYKKDLLAVLNDTIFLIKKRKEQWVKISLDASFMKKGILTSIMIDGDFIWFSFNKRGAYKCKIEGEKIIVIRHFLKDKRVSRVFKDNRDGYWFQILNEGVYYLPSDNIAYKDWKYNKLKYIEIDTLNGDLFLAFEDGKIVSKSKENKGEKVLVEKREFQSEIHFDDENNLLLIGGGTNFLDL